MIINCLMDSMYGQAQGHVHNSPTAVRLDDSIDPKTCCETLF